MTIVDIRHAVRHLLGEQWDYVGPASPAPPCRQAEALQKQTVEF